MYQKKHMKWTKQQIEDHKKAAKLLGKIKDETFQHIKSHKNVSEFEVQEFVRSRFKKYNLKTDTWRPIISFRQNTAHVHYYASEKKAKKLKPESLVLIDIWVRLNKKGAPFADITWMGYFGKKVPAEIKNNFYIVIGARDRALEFIKKSLKQKIVPTGREIDNIVGNYLAKFGVREHFLHGTGHPLGFISDHGRGVYINQKGKGRLEKNVGYTIEPGIYLKNKFGLRSEIDFYIDEKYKLIITTKMQKEIVIL
jgi:Xaa-Pro aminopeptidase